MLRCDIKNYFVRRISALKIVLVAQNSSYTHTNAAVRIFARLLSPKHEVKIIETTVNDRGGVEAVSEKLYREKADMYAFSVYIWNRTEQLLSARIIKQLLPDCIVAIGGPEVSYEKEDFISRNPYVDYLIRGEGEQAICDIADGKYKRGSIIDGGIFNGFSVSSEPYYSETNAICGSLGENENYDGKLIYYESSRGCPYNCSYCLSSAKRPGEHVRAKTAEFAAEEIKILMSHNVKAIKFVDRTFNFDIARAKYIFIKIMEFAKENTEKGKYSGPTCHFEICAALIDDETIDILSDAPEGLFRFEIGVQTATSETLEAIGRRNDTEKIITAVKKLRERTRVTVHLDLICGLPLDTVEGIKKSFNLIYGLCDCLQMGFLKLLPGTRLREEAGKYGMIYLDMPPYTVLCNSTVSFDEMRMLSRIADAAEKFSEKDSGFFSSLEYLIGKARSAFDFYDELSSFLSKNGAVSSRKMYEEIFLFAEKQGYLKDGSSGILREKLRYDFLLSNQGTPPAAIDRKYSDDEKEYIFSVRRAVIHEKPKEDIKLFVPALEAHLFLFDEDSVYLIDRKNHCFEVRKKAELCNMYNIEPCNCAKDKF
jgi:radical SAM superfamily enzyme YgiQ (UPF0313 family)